MADKYTLMRHLKAKTLCSPTFSDAEPDDIITELRTRKYTEEDEQCEHCLKQYSSKQTLNRHKRICKVALQQDLEDTEADEAVTGDVQDQQRGQKRRRDEYASVCEHPPEQAAQQQQTVAPPLLDTTVVAGLQCSNVRKTDETPPRVSVIDVIAAVLGCNGDYAAHAYRRLTNNARATSSSIKSDLDISYHQFEGQGQRKTPVIPAQDIQKLVDYVIAGARMPLEKKRRLTEGAVPVRSYVEQETLSCLRHAFQDLTLLTQHIVCPQRYRIDMYIPDLNIAIECDEHGHKGYNPADEELRMRRIEAELPGLRWLRYNPNVPGFNMFDVVFRLRTMIAHSEVQDKNLAPPSVTPSTQSCMKR